MGSLGVCGFGAILAYMYRVMLQFSLKFSVILMIYTTGQRTYIESSLRVILHLYYFLLFKSNQEYFSTIK